MPEIPLPIPARAVKPGSAGLDDYFLMVVDGLLRKVPADQAQASIFHSSARTFLGNPSSAAGPAIDMSPQVAKDLLGIVPEDVHGLAGLLANKANLIHTHAIADVVGLQAALDSIIAGQSLPTLHYATYALLAADIVKPDDTLGLVYADPIVKTTQRARASNVATITTATPHGYATGRKVNVRNLGGVGYNAAGVTITSTGANTFTYASSGANESTTADTAGEIEANGVYQFDDPSNIWTWISDAPFQVLERRIGRLEGQILDLAGQPQNAGDLFYNDGTGVSGTSAPSGGWASRWHLRNAVINPMIFSDRSLYQVQGSSTLGTPSTKIAVSPSSTFIHTTTDGTGVVWIVSLLGQSGRLNPDNGYIIEWNCPLGDLATTGVGVSFSAQPPATDGSIGTIPTDGSTETLIWQASGGVTVYEHDAFTVANTIHWTRTGADAGTWDNNALLQIMIAVDQFGTSADVTFSINGNITGRGLLTGLIAGLYVGPAYRSTNIAVGDCSIYKMTTPNDGVRRNWYVDPSVGSTGNGTVKSPWKNFKDAVQQDNSDPAQGYYEIIMKRGICLDAPSFDGKKVREVILRSSAGHGAKIYNARYYPAGSAIFTRPNAATYPNVWQITIPPDVSASCMLINASDSQPNGRTGKKTTEFRHLSRAAFNTDIATINTKFEWASVHYEGTYKGKILFNSAGTDPNNKNYYLARGAGISVDFTTDAQFNGAKLIIEGMTFGFCMDAGISIARGRLEAADFEIYGTYGPGINVNEGDWRLYGGTIRGTVQDNFNNSGGISIAFPGTSNPDRQLFGQIFGTRFWGCPVGLNDSEVFGDCFSNHARHEVYIDGAEAFCAAKDGFGCVDRFTVKDCIVEDCVQAAVEQASFPPPDSVHSNISRVIGGRFTGNRFGVMTFNSGPFNDFLEIDGGTCFDSNVDASIRTNKISSGVSIVTARDWSVMGTTPANGHVDIGGGGEIRYLTPRSLGSF